MKLYILDAESYYDREFNLRRIDPACYILDPRFELIGIAVKEPGSPGDLFPSARHCSQYRQQQVTKVWLE